MAIHYTCRCGANIRLPNNVVGRKARCNSCGLIFVVPQPEKAPEPEPGIPLEPGLPDRVPPKPAATPPNPVSLEIGNREDILAPAHEAKPYLPPVILSQGDDFDDFELGRSYWSDLLGSFLFFLDGGNCVTFVFISLIQLLAMGVRFNTMILIGRPYYMLFLPLLIYGYLCTFYMAIIKETAGGEDELPNIMPDGFFDLGWSIAQFVGTWICVLLPAAAFAWIEYANFGQVNWPIVKAIAVIGLFFWPVVIMGVSIGGGFYGLWPHIIIRTAAAAPLAYLALCGVLLVTVGLNYLPYSDLAKPIITAIVKKGNSSHIWLLTIANAFITTYTTIVAMHAIGLYYRYYKRKFPWTAE